MNFNPTNPDLYPGLRHVIERGTVPQIPIWPYISEYDVPCAFCDHHQKHRRGSLVEMADGRRALCGIQCAEKFFGEDVLRKIKSDLDRLGRRIDRQKIVAPLIDGVAEVLKELAYWIPLEIELEMALSRLLNGTFNPGGPVSLRRSVTETGTIDRVIISTFDAEERRPDGTSRIRKHEHHTVLGRVKGAAVLTMKDRCFVKADRKLDLIREKTESAKLTDPILEQLVQVRRDTIGCLTDGIERCETAARFFQRPNIEELGRWFVQEDPIIGLEWISRSSTEHSVVVRRRGRVQDEIGVPTFAELPSREKLIDPLRQRPREAVA